MQIKSMPTNTSIFKNKWNHFIQKISPKPQQECIPPVNGRKYSDTMSVGTFDSNTSISDKFRHALPTFLRRSSSGHITHDQEITYDYLKELEKCQALYLLTLDELNYAEDSKGSSYYSGDLVAAREALDDCTSAFMQLLRHTIDPIARESLQKSISPKLLHLQKRLKALPEDNDDS